MQNENTIPTTEYEKALSGLIAMGLVDVFFLTELRPVYRLSEAIYAELTLNAALFERLE